MKIKNYAWLLAFALIACESDDDSQEQPIMPPPAAADPTILIGNQGNFNSGNASLTLFNEATEVASQEVYAAANDGDALGDVLHSIYHYNNEYYVVMNNSSKISVLNDTSLVEVRSIVGLDSPRFMMFISDTKAYVTDFISNTIHIIDPSNGTYLGDIQTGFWVEKMVMHNGEVWCTAPTEGKAIVLNPFSDEQAGEVLVGSNASEIVVDETSDIWVLCQGTYLDPIEEPSLYRIDAVNRQIEASFTFASGTGFGGLMEISDDNDELLMLIGGAVLSMDITDTALPTESFISRSGQFFYGLSVNPDNGDILVTDAVDYVQPGTAYIYDEEGGLKYEIAAGALPWTAVWN